MDFPSFGAENFSCINFGWSQAWPCCHYAKKPDVDKTKGYFVKLFSLPYVGTAEGNFAKSKQWCVFQKRKPHHLFCIYKDVEGAVLYKFFKQPAVDRVFRKSGERRKPFLFLFSYKFLQVYGWSLIFAIAKMPNPWYNDYATLCLRANFFGKPFLIE